jgi:hypothetical protein
LARFRYLGEIPRRGVKAYGPCVALRLPSETGGRVEVRPPPGAARFEPGADLGLEVTDGAMLRALRGDPRFEEIE